MTGGVDFTHTGLGGKQVGWKRVMKSASRGEGGLGWLNVEERVGRSRVVHSDPAATIKIGGVRCLHSSLCKSHQPEPFFVSFSFFKIPRGWLHHH